MEKCKGFQFIYTPLIIIPVPRATDPILYHDECISQSSKELLAKKKGGVWGMGGEVLLPFRMPLLYQSGRKKKGRTKHPTPKSL